MAEQETKETKKDYKTRDDFNQMLEPRRKWSVLEWIGYLVMWLGPAVIIGIVIACKGYVYCEQTTWVKAEPWVSIVLIITAFVYIKFLRKKVRDKLLADNIKERKHHPLLVLGRTMYICLPFVVAWFIIDFVTAIGENINYVIIAIIINELVAGVILFIDSLQPEIYY